ncbi:MAG: four helix bundle protein [Verrucomicrobiota bacterium]|nr:four helix bundle protein [Verrucomicrobiota bacterium]
MSSEFEKCDLRERTTAFAIQIVQLYRDLPMQDRYDIQVAGKQIIRSGTSVAANYREASRARSKADFISKIDICTQEADETLLWLEVLNKGCKLNLEIIEPLKREANELISIFVTMSKNSKG